MERKVDEVYQELLQMLKVVIERDFQPYNLEEHLKTVLYDLAYEAVKQNWTGTKLIFVGVLWAVGLARHYAKKYNKDFGYYLDRILKKGSIENYVLAFRRIK